MFGRKKVEIISEDSVCWNQESYYTEKWRKAWIEWVKLRQGKHNEKVIANCWNAFVKADKDLKNYVERVYG